MALERFHNFVDGEYRNNEANRWIPSFNPYTGQVWAEVPRSSEQDVDLAVTAALSRSAW